MPPGHGHGPMIQLDSLSKTYGSRARAVHALRDVSLSLEPGIWAVVGPNGAGKTTLLGLVLGFLRPSSGSVTVDGDPPRHWLRRHGAGYLPERFRVPPQWPVRSALRALARLDGGAAADADRRVDAALDRLGLADHADRAVGTLSRGLGQRLGLAQALLADRRLVVLDEPTEGLDPLWRVRFREIVADLRGGDRTVLLASHELAEVERIADRVIILDDGRVADVVDARERAGGPLRYRLVVDATDQALAAAFPAAERVDYGVVVTVADAGELSHRLAALLDAGATVREVTPFAGDLETRVRARLEDG
jgi:ABC-2 type transport system ATP-binding protein